MCTSDPGKGMKTTNSKRLALLICAIGAVGVGAFFLRAVGRHEAAVAETPEPSATLPVQKTSMAMGTFVTICASSPDEAAAAGAIKAAFDEVRRLEGLLSRFDEKSDVSAVNAAAGGDAVEVDPATFEVFGKALEVCELSGGAFDVTVGGLVALWSEARKAGRPPSDEAISAAMERVSSKRLVLDAAGALVTVSGDGVSVDLGAIAKGFVAQRAAEVLRERGITSGFVDAGGDIVFIGGRHTGQPWRVGVADPRDNDKLADRLFVRDCAVVTSGNYRRYWAADGRRYSHIIDARTGRAAEGPDSVTVISEDGAAADAWATALSVLGADGREAAEEAGVEFMMYGIEDGEIVRIESEGFAAFRKDGTDDEQ